MKKSIAAGIYIGLAGFAFLNVGGVVGAVLFAFGLTGVILYKLNLYTGKAGVYSVLKGGELKTLAGILLGNVIGCAIIGLATAIADSSIVEANLAGIIETRKAQSLLQILVLSMGTGLIMETAVAFGARHTNSDKIVNWIPVLLGVPLFILCKMPHSIADIYYYSAYLFSGGAFELELLLIWLVSVVGNYLGCNAMSLFVNKE